VIVNKLNGKCYVGSSKSLQSRLRNYFNLAHLAAQKNRPLSHAIIKYGLVNFAFIIVEEVDMTENNLEDRETYWIKHIRPDYIGTKEAARNVGASHTEETKARISKTKSQGSIYIYDTFKQLLAIAPSMISLAILLGNKSISISLVRAIKEGSLYRSLCYLSRIPFKEGEKPLIEVPSPEYTAFIDRLKAKKHIRKSVFVTKDGKFLCEYEGIMAASKDLKIGHDMIKKNIVNKTTYRGYRFSYHREQD